MRYFVLLLVIGCGGGTFSEPGTGAVSDAGLPDNAQCFPYCAGVACGGTDARCGSTCETGSGCAFQGCKVDCTATAVAQCTDPSDPNTPTARCVTDALIACSTQHSDCCTAHAAQFPRDQCG